MTDTLHSLRPVYRLADIAAALEMSEEALLAHAEATGMQGALSTLQ